MLESTCIAPLMPWMKPTSALDPLRRKIYADSTSPDLMLLLAVSHQVHTIVSCALQQG